MWDHSSSHSPSPTEPKSPIEHLVLSEEQSLRSQKHKGTALPTARALRSSSPGWMQLASMATLTHQWGRQTHQHLQRYCRGFCF